MAFKKPFHDVKTSAPLRSSDRRKLKQRVVQTFALEPEAGDILVPESLLSLKFSTHLDEPGVVYLSHEGDPLWFTLGKVSNDLIPTVYTLWKYPTLLPVLSTPSAVIPVLIGGADLMIPGVVQHPSHIDRTDLAAVIRHTNETALLAPPLAVGRMAVRAEELREGAKGKAVHILHTFGDSLWSMGSKAEPPEGILQPGNSLPQNEEQISDPDKPSETVPEDGKETQSQSTVKTSDTTLEPSQIPELSPAEVTAILRTCTIHAIHSQLSLLPSSAFPIPASSLYSNYILPCRPLSSGSTPIDIKHSSQKNLTSFLKTLEKDGLLRLKDFKGDLNVLGVNASHVEVKTHKPYRTVGDKEKTEEKKAEREKTEKSKPKEMVVRELWKPHAQSIHFFEQVGKNPKELYSAGELRIVINEYVEKHSLANSREQQYIHPDELMMSVLSSPKANETIQYLKRDEATKRFTERMQNWHEVRVDGKDPVMRKGQLKAISVVVRVRQGRKASTLITGYETFFIAPEFLSEELKRICATSTSVSPMPGKGNAMEVLVQGKQIKAVTELLLAQGVPKRWIEAVDLSDKK